MKSLREVLIDNVRNLRYKHSWSQMKLAEEAHISTGMVGEMESGKKLPSLETLEKLATAFKVPPYVLLRNLDETEEKERILSNTQKIDLVVSILESLELE